MKTNKKLTLATVKKSLEKSRRQKDFQVGDKIKVKDLMQSGYTYTLTQPMGKNFHPDFQPEVTPAEMLRLGVFEGKYMKLPELTHGVSAS